MPKIIISVLLALLISLTLTTSSIGASKKVVYGLFTRANAAYEIGNYKQALGLFRQIMKLAADGRYSDREWAAANLGLAETLRSMGQFKEAEETFKKALKYSQKDKNRKNGNMCRILNGLSLLYVDLGRFPEAENYGKQSEEISGDFASYSVNNLVRLYLEWGKTEQAREYLAKAVAIAEKRKFRNTIAVPYACFNKAYLAALSGQYPEAEKHFDEALSTLKAQVGEDHPYCYLILSGRAKLFCKESRFSLAEKTLREVVQKQTNSLGEDHPEVVKGMVELAAVLCDQGKYQEAEQVVSKAIKSEERIYGGLDNIFVARAKHCLGNIKRQDGRYDEAQSLIEQALAKTESTFGRKHLETAAVMRDLAKVRLYQASQGDYQAAETLLKEAQANVESLTGPDHPDRATTARDLGFLYLRESRFEEAEPQFKTALDISQRILGERHAVTADSARDLGELYLLQAKLDEAKTYLERALSIDEKLYGIDAPQVAADLLSLANVFKAQNNSPEAKKLIKRANGIRDKLAITSTDSTPLLEIPVAFSSAKDRPVREKWALSIGVSNFKDSTINLKYAAKDATDFKNFLVSSERFKTDHVKLLTDENATRENIIATLGDKWLGKLAHKDDLVLVYISSHGSTSQDDAGGVNFLVAHDTDKNSLLATGIPMQWLTKMIKDQVNSDRVILILDVCHSGAAASGGKALSRIMAMTPNGLTIGSGQMVLCSSRSEQVSWESKTYENSVFTRRLMEALRVNQDKTTLLEAYNKLKDLVEAEVLRDRANLQTPVLWNKDWSGSDPVIAIETVSASSTD